MHHEEFHTQSVGKVHKVLLDNPVRTGVGTATVAEDHHGMGIWVLLPEMFVPYPRDVVTDKLGCVMAGSNGQVALVLRDIVDAVRHNLAVGKGLEVVVKGLGVPHAEGTTITLEVADEFLLLGIDAKNGESKPGTFLTHVADVQELCVPFLGIPHGKVLEELTVAKAKRLKYLTDMILRDFTSEVNHAPMYLRDRQRHPENILVLWQSCEMRLDDQTKRLHPFGMVGQLELASATRTADAPLPGSIPGAEFADALTDCIFAVSHFFTNFADAMSAKGERAFRKVVPHLAFIELRHKRQTCWRKAFWRSFLSHFKSLAITLKVKKISPDFLYCIIDNQYVKLNFYHFFRRSADAHYGKLEDRVLDPDFRLAAA